MLIMQAPGENEIYISYVRNKNQSNLILKNQLREIQNFKKITGNKGSCALPFRVRLTLSTCCV